MKFRTFFTVAAALAAFAACKPAYKATDTTTTTTTSTPNSATTSTTTTVTVPPGTQTAFTTQYPGATNVVWSSYDPVTIAPIDWELAGWTPMEAKDHLVRFDMENENYYAWYDSKGNWVGSAYPVKDHAKLPAAVNTTVAAKYPGYSISSVNREFQKDKTAYEIELKKDDTKTKLLVDADGNIIKEKTKTIK